MMYNNDVWYTAFVWLDEEEDHTENVTPEGNHHNFLC